MPLSKITELLTAKPSVGQAITTESDLLNAESALGRTIFGPIPAGQSRDFFCYRKNVWLWYENGITIRYEVRPEGVFKKYPGSHYHLISGQELDNFRQATKTYLNLVKNRLYNN